MWYHIALLRTRWCAVSNLRGWGLNGYIGVNKTMRPKCATKIWSLEHINTLALFAHGDEPLLFECKPHVSHMSPYTVSAPYQRGCQYDSLATKPSSHDDGLVPRLLSWQTCYTNQICLQPDMGRLYAPEFESLLPRYLPPGTSHPQYRLPQ